MSENPLRSLTAANVVIVAGKGGVGKTTVTAVIARAASRSGRRVLALELDGKPTLSELLPPRDGESLVVEQLSAPELLEEYLNEHGFKRVAKRLNRTGVIDMIGTAAPGIDDIVVLGKVKAFERSGDFDLVVVDGPAAGHAVTFLTSASGLADAVRGGPIKAQSDDVLELLNDAERCLAVLVTLPETTPVNETIETAYALEDDVGIQLGPVVVNGVDVGADLASAAEVDRLVAGLDSETAQMLRDAADFRRSRREMESASLERLSTQLPLGQVVVAALPKAGLDADDIDELADQMLASGGDSGSGGAS